VTGLHFDEALVGGRWLENVRIELAAGRIAAIVPDSAPGPGDERHAVALPGMPNLHSHAFQRGMAGLAETRGTGIDSFWSWRETMYRFALAMTPDDAEAIAAQAYVEMLEAGFTRVGEFHYLHHDLDGSTYSDPAEMAARICAASDTTGIGLTLLPVLYAHAGFAGTAPQPQQRRFISDLDLFARMLERSRALTAGLDNANLGVAPHSLRAVTPEELSALVPLAGDGPIHIHVAEQMREVDDCLSWSGRRPVEWLLENADLDRRWCLIHATHMTGKETVGVAESGATVGLCPITEANLGDGIFDGLGFLAAGGRIGIGSDSNVEIGAAAELRQLEYSQRLARQSRNVLAESGGSTGRRLYELGLQGGAAALGQPLVGLTVGAPADIVSLDAEHPALVARHRDSLIDSLIFSAGRSAIDCVWTMGRKQVSEGRHVRRDEVFRRFHAALSRLIA